MAITLGWIVFAALVGLAVMQSLYVWIHCRFLESEVDAEFDAPPNDLVLSPVEERRVDLKLTSILGSRACCEIREVLKSP